jgi:hypothetical protein
MLIVPLKNDVIETADGEKYTVAAFNSLYTVNKKFVPAVYINEKKPQEGGIITFDKIVSIKGKAVEFNAKLGLFECIGPFKRIMHIPQPNDTVVAYVSSKNISDSDPGFVIGHVKLSSSGNSPSMRIGFTEKGDDSIWYDLSKIILLKNGQKFDSSKFKKIYQEYMPFNAQ